MRKLILITVIATMFASCTNVLDTPINSEKLAEISSIIEKCDTLKKMEKKYITDNLKMYAGFAMLGKSINPDISSKITTFRTNITELSSEFRTKEQKYITAKENNAKLKNFLSITDASCWATSEYKGSLNMNLHFNNKFNKEILYIIMRYSFINKYDSKFFEEKVKLTDEVAGDFKKDKAISTTEKYNSVAKFLYRKVYSNKEKQKKQLLEGLKVETLGIVFKDKTEMFPESEDWDYLAS